MLNCYDKVPTTKYIDCYKKAFLLSNYVWDIIIKWDWFEKKAIGIQFVTAIDSISANIAEGFGRYSFGSVKESLDWNEKSKIRKLLTKVQYGHIFNKLQELPREIHQLIKFTNIKLKE